MHDDALKYYKQRVKEEKEHHRKQQQMLEARFIQATATEASVADDECWLINRSISTTIKHRKLKKEEKALIELLLHLRRTKVSLDTYESLMRWHLATVGHLHPWESIYTSPHFISHETLCANAKVYLV